MPQATAPASQAADTLSQSPKANHLRECRRLRSLSRRERAEARRDREREVSIRMIGRFFNGDGIHLILLDYRYWLARRCQWNPLSPQWRITGAKYPDGRDILYDPKSSPMWLWWANLHHRQRYAISRMNPTGLRRASKSLQTPTYLSILKDLTQ